MDLTLDV